MKNKTDKSGAISDADTNQGRATQVRPRASSQNSTSRPPKSGGILFFDEADALYDEPIEAQGDEDSNGKLNRP